VYFLIRVYQAFAHRPEPEAPPVSGLQLTPTSIWPALGGAVLAVLLIGMTAVWSRLDHRALTTAVAPSSRPVQTADSNIDGGKKVTLQLTQESLFGSWKAPGAGDFKEIFAHFDKNGSGCLRGTFAAGGGIRWDFQYEIDAAMNTAVLYADGKRRGAVELTSKSEIRVTIPDVGLFGPECNFTRDMK
jgi:hypothetical protein